MIQVCLPRGACCFRCLVRRCVGPTARQLCWPRPHRQLGCALPPAEIFVASAACVLQRRSGERSARSCSTGQRCCWRPPPLPTSTPSSEAWWAREQSTALRAANHAWLPGRWLCTPDGQLAGPACRQRPATLFADDCAQQVPAPLFLSNNSRALCCLQRGAGQQRCGGADQGHEGGKGGAGGRAPQGRAVLLPWPAVCVRVCVACAPCAAGPSASSHGIRGALFCC